MEKEWFREWFDVNYKLLYDHRDMSDAQRQVDLILNRVRPGKEWKILDLCCGEGRHSALIRNRGYDITGLDLSETLIRSGRVKFPGLNLLRCDMRAIPGRFDLILSLFTSFGYFEEETEDRKVITGVYESLNSPGVFWLDFLNSDQVRNTLSHGRREREMKGVRVIEEKKIQGDRINKKITFIGRTGERKYVESVRLYSRPELSRMLENTGFKILDVFGDYSGSEWSTGSERTIFHCRKI